MPPKSSSSSRIVAHLLRPSSRPRTSPSCDCVHSRYLSRNLAGRQPTSTRHVSTISSRRAPEMEVEGDDGASPRWSQTPPAMRGTVRIKPPRPGNIWKVNSDPQKLDGVYVRILGKDGDKMLSEETKWLAVTSKSYDYGRRGFNDRLAFFGKRILELQCSLGLIGISDPFDRPIGQDPHGRRPFIHPATESVECLLSGRHDHLTNYKNLSMLAQTYSLPEVVRWQPRNPDRLMASGADMVYAQALLAIIGALALERGGAVANAVAKEKVLVPMGLRADLLSSNLTEWRGPRPKRMAEPEPQPEPQPE